MSQAAHKRIGTDHVIVPPDTTFSASSGAEGRGSHLNASMDIAASALPRTQKRTPAGTAREATNPPDADPAIPPKLKRAWNDDMM
jgi:hypothetical protein